jgi:3-methyladenine DNA glycosylase AlkC
MPEPFKNFFNVPLVEKLAALLARGNAGFEVEKFMELATANFEALELKQRSNQIRDALVATLPNAIAVAGPVLISTLGPEAPIDGGTTQEGSNEGLSGFIIMPLADFVAEIGRDKPEESFAVLEELTKRFSSEFAVRPFILDDPKGAMQQFDKWAKSDNAHVRRLASEGCRPLLPWGLRLNPFVNDPSPILPILETLKDDETEYVRRSVANNLNDIAKNQPDLVADIAGKWLKGATRNRERLVRHACRTLIKKGHKPTLQALGYGELDAELSGFALASTNIKLGDALQFSFEIKSTAKKSQPFILDYAIHFKKANGSTAPKVFKLKTGELNPGETLRIEKSHLIKKITTMVFYEGEHKIELLANGKSLASLTFTLAL